MEPSGIHEEADSAILLATVWIATSEFVRNEFPFKHLWVDHYASLGLAFPSEPVNGAVWGLWSLLSPRHHHPLPSIHLLQTTGIAWLFAFVLMWVVTGNMAVLPFGILPYAVPLSLLETFVAAWIVRRVGGIGSNG